jgi:hypothetical protein
MRGKARAREEEAGKGDREIPASVVRRAPQRVAVQLQDLGERGVCVARHSDADAVASATRGGFCKFSIRVTQCSDGLYMPLVKACLV